jgi:integrase
MPTEIDIAETGRAGDIIPPNAPQWAAAGGFAGVSVPSGLTAAGQAALSEADRYGVAVRQITPQGEAALKTSDEYARKAAAPATLRAYRSDWQDYKSWCAKCGFEPTPSAPETVGAYLASLAQTKAPTTIRRRLAAIAKMHKFNNWPWNSSDLHIQGPLQGVLREHGRPVKKAAAITEPVLRKLLETCDFSARGCRDRALILIGFVGALRRSELVGLDVKDVTVDAKGMRIRIMRSKTDRAGEGAEIGIPRGKHAETCAVSAYERWRMVADRKTGPVFFRISSANRVRTPKDKKSSRPNSPVAAQKAKKQGFDTRPLTAQSVSDILVKRAAMAGVVIEGFDRFSAHSLRVGFITAAYEKGVRDEDIMKHSRHKDLRTMRGYVERAGLLDQSPVGALDL